MCAQVFISAADTDAWGLHKPVSPTFQVSRKFSIGAGCGHRRTSSPKDINRLYTDKPPVANFLCERLKSNQTTPNTLKFITNKFAHKFAIGVDNSPQGEYDRPTGQVEIRVTNSVG